jgi:hypothetical protein
LWSEPHELASHDAFGPHEERTHVVVDIGGCGKGRIDEVARDLGGPTDLQAERPDSLGAN